MSGPSSGSYISQRLRLHYVDWGNPDSPTVILLHGLLDNCRSWDWVAEQLRDDFNIIAPDLRGHGDSDHAPAGIYSTAAYLLDLAQFVRRFRHRRVAIVGHGLGGQIALAYAGIYPTAVSRVVAIEGLGDPPTVVSGRVSMPFDQRLATWIRERQEVAGRIPKRYATLEEAYARVRWENPHLTPEQARHLTEHGSQRNEDDTFSWKFDNYVRAPGGPWELRDQFRDLWTKITCPALLVFGAETGMANQFDDDTFEALSTARIEVINGAGHWPHHGQLAAFISVVRDFLAPPATPSRQSYLRA